jgi:hypothetical protein
MIQNRTAINGILAAVLSANFLPIHRARAREKPSAPQKPASGKNEQAKHEQAETPRIGAVKPGDASATIIQ